MGEGIFSGGGVVGREEARVLGRNFIGFGLVLFSFYFFEVLGCKVKGFFWGGVVLVLISFIRVDIS